VAFQAIQVIFALAICAAYGAVQFGLVRPDDPRYLLTNFLSAAGLAGVAVLAFQLGFVISNGLWAAVSLVGLVRFARRRGLGQDG
jgi:hypothetical protein